MKATTHSVYESSGVNVKLCDLYSSFCGTLCRESYENSLFVKIHDYSRGHYRGRRGFELVNLPPGSIMTAGSDGIGTKTIIIDAAEMHFTAANNLLAMLGEDFTRDGCMPLLVLNDLNVGTLGKDAEHPTFAAAQELMLGLANSAKDQGYVMFSGETAEMPDCVSSENPDAILKFNWSGVMIGAMHEDKLITGQDICEGDWVIAFRDVTRSNGISMLRKGLRHRYGKEWYKSTDSDAVVVIQEAASPSVLYSKFLVFMNGWTSKNYQPIVKARLIAHLSGGGIQSKFGDDLLFPLGWSAHLDNLWKPPQVLRDCVQDLNVPDEECYEVSGCGQGVLVVVAEKDAALFIDYATMFNIESRYAGVIKATSSGDTPSITLTSGFTGRKVILNQK